MAKLSAQEFLAKGFHEERKVWRQVLASHGASLTHIKQVCNQTHNSTTYQILLVEILPLGSFIRYRFSYHYH